MPVVTRPPRPLRPRRRSATTHRHGACASPPGAHLPRRILRVSPAGAQPGGPRAASAPTELTLRRPLADALRGLWLAGARLSRLDLAGADAEGACLAGAVLSDCDLTAVRLVEADLCGARLVRTCLRGADLRGADLTGATFEDCELAGADLRGARGVSPQPAAVQRGWGW